MTQLSSLIIKNIKTEKTHNYLFTSMVSHRGIPVSFAMSKNGAIIYSVLDLAQNTSDTVGVDNDKNYWSKLIFKSGDENRLDFPNEIAQVGYGVIPNFQMGKYDRNNEKVIHSYDKEGKPLDKNGIELSNEAIKDKTSSFYSSTRKLGAKQPFQVLSSDKYIYLFRQSITADDPDNESPVIVNSTLLVDRFILSGDVLKLSREVRYQRSRHKTEPESKKDTLAAVDLEGTSFYEPTRELTFANNLSNGNFSVLLIPGINSEEQRWQIFTGDSKSNKINSFNIKFDDSIIFDTSNSQIIVNEFISKYGLDHSFISNVQEKINAFQDNTDIDAAITTDLLSTNFLNYDNLDENARKVLKDDLNEMVYILRTGVMKDDFTLESTSHLPLIEYEPDGSIKSNYLENDILIQKYTFQSPSNELKPENSSYIPKHGLSSCYYYQQEMANDGKPMKNKARVMLALGLEDELNNKYIGILNFSVVASGRLSRLTTDAVNMPDINVQALDQNPYSDLKTLNLNKVTWQPPQKMGLLDIDSNGLSTSGGVLKFAYTGADIGVSQGYSDAVVATDPYLFDDSLGRINLYFKGKHQNFFVLYFNPTGSKSIQITDLESNAKLDELLPLSLKPRLDRDMNIHVVADVPNQHNICTLTMTSAGQEVEKWNYLPQQYLQIASILNGNGELPLGTLDPLGNTNDLRVAYIKENTNGNGKFNLRTTVDNHLVFQDQQAYASLLADGNTHDVPLNSLSAYLANNTSLRIAKKSFSLTGNVTLKASVLYKSYISDMVNDNRDSDTLWDYLKNQDLIQETTGQPNQGILKSIAITGTLDSLKTILTDAEIDNLSLELLKEGNIGDKKARRARLKKVLIDLILDVAKVRIITFYVQDTNVQQIDRLEAGLAISVVYDYTRHFIGQPEKLGGTSTSKWEHARSYLFNAEFATNTETEISDAFNYQYLINNTIGQWENWEASLALELNPTSAKNGPTLNTTDANKLEGLCPTEKGLSVEAWIKPSENPNVGSILYYEKGEQHYSLGIKKDSTNTYKCVATLGNKKYTSKKAFSFEQWRHLAFTHQKYWGYRLEKKDSINCGKDSSLQLKDEFSLEVLVKIDKVGTLLKKKEEYSLSINSDKEVVFKWGKRNFLSDCTDKLDDLDSFYKITLIRSKNKPSTAPTKAEYFLTGGSQENDSDSDSKKKWYEGKDKDQIIKGMAEKQDQLDKKMNFSQANMFGSTDGQSSESNPKYYHTLIVTNPSNGSSTEWTSITAQEVEGVEAFQNFIIGEDNFEGTFASIRIWNRALSPSEAKVLALPENKAGLLSHWRMTEGKGTYLYDEGNENHGVVNGGKWVDSPQDNQLGQFQFYVDGSLETYDTPTNNTLEGVEQLSIGGIKKMAGFGEHFKGTLEEIRIWNTPRTNEQITDNAFGRLKGEWEALLANYTFDKLISQTNDQVQDASVNSVTLTIHNKDMLKEVLSTAPIATEIPQVRSALTGVLTTYNGTIVSRPSVVEYGDVQRNDDGTLNGILKRCYSFIDRYGVWNRMTGYKVGNLISQWYGQTQFEPQVMGYLEGPAPVPGENFPIGKDADIDTYAYLLDNSVHFNEAKNISYNYSTSKESGWNVAVQSEMKLGAKMKGIIAPLGMGVSFDISKSLVTESNWKTSGKRSQSFEQGTSINTEREFSIALPGYDNGKTGVHRYYKLSNTGFALVKSKTADIYLLRLAHNHALVSIFWKPNPDIPEDVNILSFPINPLYIKQGTLDGKFGETTDEHYPQAQGSYGEYSYFKPREAYKLKKQIEWEKLRQQAYFEDLFDVTETDGPFKTAVSMTSLAGQLPAFFPGKTLYTALFNQSLGQVATQVAYNRVNLKDDLVKMGSQRNLVNTYVWTIEGGFYSESIEVAKNQQETYSKEMSLSLGGGIGRGDSLDISGVIFEQKTLFSSGSDLTITKTKTEESNVSFGLDVNVGIPTSARHKYGGADGRTLIKGLILPGMVDAYRFMSFYLDSKEKNGIDLFSKVIDPIWLEESSDPNARVLREVSKKTSCWRIMHRVTYVSRILPEFQPEAPPSLEKTMRTSGMESNYMLIKKFEPYVANITDSGAFFAKIEAIIERQLPEFIHYKQQIKSYLALYFNIN